MLEMILKAKCVNEHCKRFDKIQTIKLPSLNKFMYAQPQSIICRICHYHCMILSMGGKKPVVKC